MVGIKRIFSSQEDVRWMIFEEVDRGVRGRVGEGIAEKMDKV